ncbi:uncharacterized protein [Nicotiana tomentosiformis]|uniref:uncharacterized protein n=1 Tax=Nicotiana tomentosiformis TaxID=4098 RepID=UPI00388C509A
MSDEEQKRLEWFGRLRPPSFRSAESKDAQDILDRCQRILHTTGILETSEVPFTTFHQSGVSFKWWEAYELITPVGASPHTWHEFFILFLKKFVLYTYREELRRQFEKLHQEERERIRRFIDGLNYGLRFVITREIALGAWFDEVVDIARRLEQVLSQERDEREAKRPLGLDGFNGASSGGQSHHSSGRPYRPAQMAHLVHYGT